MNTSTDTTNQELTLSVDGMHCGHCKASVERGLAALPGVQTVTVDLAQKQVTLRGAVDAQTVCNTIEDLGYTVLPVQP